MVMWCWKSNPRKSKNLGPVQIGRRPRAVEKNDSDHSRHRVASPTSSIFFLVDGIGFCHSKDKPFAIPGNYFTASNYINPHFRPDTPPLTLFTPYSGDTSLPRKLRQSAATTSTSPALAQRVP
jgi:hypothetical protein